MNNIAEQRKKLGISQAVLASSIGWGQSRIANYVRRSHPIQRRSAAPA